MPLQTLDQPFVTIEEPRCVRLREPERQDLIVAPRQDGRGDIVLGCRQASVALYFGELPATADGLKRDFQVDLAVGGGHPGSIVDEVGVDPAATQSEVHPCPLGEAQVASLADDSRA